MAVSLPSDLIFDVIRNADPAKNDVATAKLRALTGSQSGSTEFWQTLKEVDIRPLQGVPPTQPGRVAENYVEFERMVLRNLFESFLPPEDSGSFGTGPSAGVWRSLAADQLAGVYARAGGIGIASAVATTGHESRGATQLDWPYFQADKIEAFTGREP